MCTNLLKLNNDKTGFILTGSQLQLAKVDNISLVVGQDTIQPTESAHNLGYYMDKELNGRAHISKLCSSLYLAIKKITRVRCMMDKETTAPIMQALILSRMDYCKSPLFGCANYQCNHLQKYKTRHSEL